MKKIISILVGTAFLALLVLPQPVFGQAQAPAIPAVAPTQEQGLEITETQPEVSATEIPKTVNPYLISVPEKYGRVEEVYEAEGEAPLVVYIQTAHANYEAQLNIKEILNHLAESYGFSLIQVEGAAAKLNPGVLRPSYHEESNLKMVDYLMRQGRLTGADAFAVETDLPVEVYGIEDPSLYAENLKMFRTVYSHKEEVDRFFADVRGFVKDLRNRLLNEELLDLTRNMEAYAKEKIELLDYLLYLDELARRHQIITLSEWKEAFRFPNLFRILRLHEMEGALNQNQLKEETIALQKAFEAKGSISEEAASILERLDQKEKGIKPRAYFKELARMAEEAGIDLLPYNELSRFAEFLILQDEVDHRALFNEIRDFEKLLKKKLLQNGDERLLLQIISYVNFLEQYYRLEANREKLAFYLEHQERIKPSWIANELKTLGTKHELTFPEMTNLEKLDGLMKELDYYYRLVLKRDLTFIDKIQERMKLLAQDKSIVVTGGFHTEGLTNLFRSGNVSYVTVIPKVDIKQGNENYVKVMLGEDTAVGSIFAGTFANEVLNLLDTVTAAGIEPNIVRFTAFTAALATADTVLTEGEGLNQPALEEAISTWNESTQTVGLEVESVSEPGVTPAETTLTGVVARPGRINEVTVTATIDQKSGTFEVNVEEGREISPDRARRQFPDIQRPRPPTRTGIGIDSPPFVATLPPLSSVREFPPTVTEVPPIATGIDLERTLFVGPRAVLPPRPEEISEAARPITAVIFALQPELGPAVRAELRRYPTSLPAEEALVGAANQPARFTPEIIAQVPEISEINQARLAAILSPEVTTPLLGIYYSVAGQATSITNPEVWTAISDLLVNDADLRLMIHHVGEKTDQEGLLEALGPELSKRVEVKMAPTARQASQNLLNPAIPFNAFKTALGIESVTELPAKTVFINLPDDEELTSKIEVQFGDAIGFQTVEEAIRAETNPVIQEALQHLGISLPVAIARIRIIKKLEVIAEAIKELGFNPEIVNFITTNLGVFNLSLIAQELENLQLDYKAARELAVKA